MTKIELCKEAIGFAMQDLCEGYLDMPSGCDGCPLCDFDNMDEDGNVNCRDSVLKEFIERYKKELEE